MKANTREAPSASRSQSRKSQSARVAKKEINATGARILGQAVKELSTSGAERYAIVSICTDGGQGAVTLLQFDGGI